jgi:hypothetical protein
MDWDRSAHQPPRVSKEMLDKTLILASLNARGLGTNSPKQKAIKLWLASLPSPPPNPPHPGTPPGKKRLRQHQKRNRVLEGSFLLESRDPHGNLTENLRWHCHPSRQNHSSSGGRQWDSRRRSGVIRQTPSDKRSHANRDQRLRNPNLQRKSSFMESHK